MNRCTRCVENRVASHSKRHSKVNTVYLLHVDRAKEQRSYRFASPLEYSLIAFAFKSKAKAQGRGAITRKSAVANVYTITARGWARRARCCSSGSPRRKRDAKRTRRWRHRTSSTTITRPRSFTAAVHNISAFTLLSIGSVAEGTYNTTHRWWAGEDDRATAGV